MLLVTYEGKREFSIWKPEIKPAEMNYPAGAEFLFIQFKLGDYPLIAGTRLRAYGHTCCEGIIPFV